MNLSITVAESLTVADVISWAKGKARKVRGKLAKRPPQRLPKPSPQDKTPQTDHGPPPLGVSASDGVMASDVFGRK